MSMSSSRPYLVRALYEWIVDNDCTPYVLVDAGIQGVDVPRQYVKNGQIVLNISPSAIAELQLDNDVMSFSARFGGVPTAIFVPMAAVLGIYARENGQGMVFEPEPVPPSPPDEPGGGPGPRPQRGAPRSRPRPALKVVK